MNFVHLHNHDHYSILDGFGKTEKWVERAVELNFKALGLTNHGNVDGCLAFQKECLKSQIKPILGAELYIVPDIRIKEKGEKRHHITLLCQNVEGWQNLLQLITRANIDGFYYKPRIDPDILLDHTKGLLILSGCYNSFLKMPGSENLLLKLDHEIYLEVMPHGLQDQKEINQLCLKYHDGFGMPLVATNDCHYPKKGQEVLQEVLLAMQTKKRWKDKDRWRFEVDGLYLKTADEMIDSFINQNILSESQIIEALENTGRIADKCDFEIPKKEVQLPSVKAAQNKNIDDYFIQLCYAGLWQKELKHSYISENIQIYQDRLVDEISLILSLKFEKYFLIVWELINWCKENDIMVGPCRGSVGGSLVAYCLNITTIDPIRFDLLFARFISSDRVDLPDIDLDFEDIKRHKVRQHLEELYGKYNVCTLSTFMKMGGRAALRNVSRVFDVPYVEVDSAAKSIIVRLEGEERRDNTIEDSFKQFEEGIRFKKKYPKVASIAIEMEGQYMGVGTHAAGMCVSKDDLRSGKNACLMMRSNDLVCCWNKEDAEYNGLMKLDVLGLTALTVISHCLKTIRKKYNNVVDLESINLDDGQVLEQFNLGNCAGVFQFNSKSMVALAKDMIVEKFDDLSLLNALHRPGTMRSGMVQKFIDRKHNREHYEIDRSLQPIVGDTYGVFVYQEQVMRLIVEVGGLSWVDADNIRKIIGKKRGEENLKHYAKKFVDGCINAKALVREKAESIFKDILSFAHYGFNKSHAVAYAMIGYWTMYLKHYYPQAFFASYLSFAGKDGKLEVFDEVRKRKVKVVLPDINISDSTMWQISDDGSIVIPFSEIKGIGPKAAEAIVEERKNGKFKNIEDFNSRLPAKVVNSRVRTILEENHCFDNKSLGEEELGRISENYFAFDISNDPMFKYRGVLSLIGKKFEIKNVQDFLKDKKPGLYFGQINSFRIYGNLHNEVLQKVSPIHCDLWDGQRSIAVVFDGEKCKTSLSFKDKIEHCAAKWALAHGKSYAKRMLVDHIWYADDFLAGNFDGLKLSFAKEVDTSFDFIDELEKCRDCKLREEAHRVVPPNIGQFNVSLCFEAPGKEEDFQGKGVVGAAGKILWNGRGDSILGLTTHYGYERSIFHVTNVCKCWPSISKTPSKVHVKACSKWLEKELEVVNPFLLLAAGNTAMKFFKGVDSGIMEQVKSNPIEWNNKYGCWICWTLHPASVLHSSENIKFYNQGIKNFCEKLYELGFKY